MNKRQYIVIIVLLFLNVLAQGVKLWAQNSTIEKGIVLGDLQTKVEILKQKNETLRNDLLIEQAYTTIDKKAKLMGFKDYQRR